jgi:opacity protein-like surface antigen
MKYRLIVIVIAACVALVACSDDKSNGPSVVVLPDTGNTTNNAQADMGTADVQFDVTPMEDFGTDTNVTNPGFLNGVWVVKIDDVARATLTIRHVEGEEMASGTFVSQEPASSGNLNAVLWQDDKMTASWNIRVDNTSATFGVSDGTAADANTLDARYTDSSTGLFTNCVVERQP